MARSCSAAAEHQDVKAGFVDLGIAPNESHTMFSTNPDTAVNAFIDFLYLMDASTIVSTGSSFSAAVAEIKGYKCVSMSAGDATDIVKSMRMCVPRHC